MENEVDVDEIKDNLEQAANEAHYAMDYFIMRIILQVSNQKKTADEKQYNKMLFVANKGFWDIGVYIDEKLDQFHHVRADFFDSLVSSIEQRLNHQQNMVFSVENLLRCYKLVNIAPEEWFDTIAGDIPWENIAAGLDAASSFSELNKWLNEHKRRKLI